MVFTVGGGSGTGSGTGNGTLGRRRRDVAGEEVWGQEFSTDNKGDYQQQISVSC